MGEIRVGLGERSYNVIVRAGVLSELGEQVYPCAPQTRCALFSDAAVAERFGAQAIESLKTRYSEVVTAEQPSGEDRKTLDTVHTYYEVLVNQRFERNSPVIAFGGGVTGDTVGFVAATYLRGVPFIQVPTTLLSMVDASVGGKVGVNLPQGKNLIGAFYQPKLVLIDPLLLTSLPSREFASGIAECIKHGMIRDPELISWLEDSASEVMNRSPKALEALIERNVAIKAGVVEADEREGGLRAILNFGHTFAHAMEACCGYGEIHHGEAVGLGMRAATVLAVELGICKDEVLTRLTSLLLAVGLPTSWTLPPNQTLITSMSLDKKVKDGKLRLIVPRGIGEVAIIDQFPGQLLESAWDAIRNPQ